MKFKMDTLNQYPTFISSLSTRSGLNYRTMQLNYTPYPLLQFSSILYETWNPVVNGTASMNPNTGVWHSIAIVRHNGTAYLFFDGVVIGTKTDFICDISFVGHPLRVGRALYPSDAGETFIGSISELDIIKNKALWVEDFTPPDDYLDTAFFSNEGIIPQIKYKRSTVYEGIELGKNYSTEEQRIGTWIDGKPLYRKVFTGVTSPFNSGLTSSNSSVKRLYGYVKDDGDTSYLLPLPYADSQANYTVSLTYTSTTGNISVFGWRNGSNYPVIIDSIIVEYTKKLKVT